MTLTPFYSFVSAFVVKNPKPTPVGRPPRILPYPQLIQLIAPALQAVLTTRLPSESPRRGRLPFLTRVRHILFLYSSDQRNQTGRSLETATPEAGGKSDIKRVDHTPVAVFSRRQQAPGLEAASPGGCRKPQGGMPRGGWKPRCVKPKGGWQAQRRKALKWQVRQAQRWL